MKAKPLFGDPCNGCGLCCVRSQCSLSAKLFGYQPLCPALTDDGLGGYSCGLLTNPTRFLKVEESGLAVRREAAALMIGGGTGCDCDGLEGDAAAREVKLPGMIEKALRTEAELSPGAKHILQFFRRV